MTRDLAATVQVFALHHYLARVAQCLRPYRERIDPTAFDAVMRSACPMGYGDVRERVRRALFAAGLLRWGGPERRAILLGPPELWAELRDLLEVAEAAGRLGEA